MKIYTKTGDKGKTSLFGGTRVPKYNLRIEAYGTVDELNSYLGLIRDQKIDQNSIETIIKIQNELFALGAMLATSPEKEFLKNGKERLKIYKTDNTSVELLESEIDKMNENLPPMTNFVLPGGHTTVSFCHISRCICRRAERITTQLADESTIDTQILVYLNRLSDYLFVLARKLTIDNKAQEIPWIPEKKQ
ncbi:cob(I)yrinic acid a,c-diamide adenosyltransferase [Lutibacter citreus]|uniref:cob(I)yrinic acid a,c-diamide adenosyltransferase n=1 Tax=Lutibacter citreus TaxID=2138210 RepID=UPI000DBE7245|nr:cob(I)yrinic acid a,c-diamide adenosyltransferase [Lutibacter citreus]